MNEFKERLLAIESNQRNLLRETRALLEEYEASDLISENEKLRRQTEQDRRRLAELRAESDKLSKENSELRISLTEQILDEKLNILRLSSRKMETYFSGQEGAQANRLRQFEEQSKAHIHKMMTASRKLGERDGEEFRRQLAELSADLEQRLDRRRRWQDEANLGAKEPMTEGYGRLGSEGVDEATVQKRIRQNRLEMKIGLNWINRLAILLILIAVGMGFSYSYSMWFNDYVRGSVFFVFGAILLAGGEWLYRRKRRTFALGLLGGGTAVLYGSVFYSYFLLGIIGMITALLLSVLVTLAVVLLSLRYESRTICALGLVGGYLPLLSYALAEGLSGPAVYLAMGYLFLLNLLLVLVSLYKKWSAVQYISFLLNTPSMLLLAGLADSRWVGAAYAFVTFLMYLLATLAYPFRFKQKLAEWDVVLLGANTVVGCGVMYGLLETSEGIEFRGLLALLFCLLYAGLGWLSEKHLPGEKGARLLFYATSLTFAVLVVPFQLGWQWTSLGWVAEACVLSVYGRRTGSKLLERAGWAVMLLCVLAFVLADLPQTALYELIGVSSPYFMPKYTILTLAALGLSVFYALEWRSEREHARRERASAEPDGSSPGSRSAIRPHNAEERRILLTFRYVSLVNLWFYGLYETFYLYDLWVPEDAGHYTFYKMLLAAAVSVLLSQALERTELLRDRFVSIYASVLHGIGCLIVILQMLGVRVLPYDPADRAFDDYLALAVMIAVNAAVFWSATVQARKWVRRYPASGEWYPVGVAAYGTIMLTALLSQQLRIENFGMTYSIAYLLIALACIVYGFRRRYVYIRRMGLALTLLCTAKLLAVDLGLSGLGSRIIAYFVAGFILLGISYVYQRVSNRMEEEAEQTGQTKGGGSPDAES
ncbi:DUF2339 domain-containing protein [Saccharibacillus sp. CPCC 101409]|uniref:DUF2339 domain-containing protein n=1 Tax=Saccharibacillus sp. CPCC 101409 TaxID=3058041 RepID=UPI002671C7C1|nr:DUF2339 domain-containing protein [Saccharibacillus sp. CPCC 101409]MDO3409988.1 DUF2339 domain-containing protein [Saccharibacillus sp. CPCC 101409]